MKIGSYLCDCPPGFKRVPAGWKLKPVQNQSNEDGMNTLQPKKITFNPLIECANKDAL